ncbi:MAG: cysteine-rich small domain-containing protein, partial [Eubacterium sp.]|nr:cysteine-rich small domain-containing protein [Eubacterium sp.]
HSGLKQLNCLFCYCPLYERTHCPGEQAYIQVGGKQIKDCSGCTFPHQPENYDRIIQFLG